MKLLIDTHVLLAVLGNTTATLPTKFSRLLRDNQDVVLASVASLWEVAIKVRLGKLSLSMQLDAIEAGCAEYGLGVLTIEARHALANVDPWPPTRDPFDRLLLAQAQVEGCQLVTLDRMLADHPLAWRP